MDQVSTTSSSSSSIQPSTYRWEQHVQSPYSDGMSPVNTPVSQQLDSQSSSDTFAIARPDSSPSSESDDTEQPPTTYNERLHNMRGSYPIWCQLNRERMRELATEEFGCGNDIYICPACGVFVRGWDTFYRYHRGAPSMDI